MNKRMLTISFVVWCLLLLAAGVSATHIVETADKLGLHDWQKYCTPALVDVVAVVGKISMATCFADAFRRSGFRLLMAGGTVSLACNVYAGDNLGERAWGALVVGAFMLLEHHATKGGRQAVLPPPADPPAAATTRGWVVTQAEKDARKRAGYATKSAADKAAWTKQYRERVSKRAPASPGQPPVDAPSVGELEAIAR